MTEIAYMVREDWAQNGTSMVPQSAAICDWLGEPPYLFAVCDPKRVQEPGSADMEFIAYVSPEIDSRRVVPLSRLKSLEDSGKRLAGTLSVVHPYKSEDCEVIRMLVDRDLVDRIFVIVWSPMDMVRIWLEGMCARNLATGTNHVAPDPVQFQAAKCMVDEQYNGLSTGNGKAAVVQLIRAFTDGGYALEKEPWLRAFFAAGGQFRHAESISTLIAEMKKGTKHRVQPRYRPNILAVLQAHVSTSSKRPE